MRPTRHSYFGGLIVIYRYSKPAVTLFETIGDGSTGQPSPANEPCADCQ
jgi:hypothetical protein